MAQTLYCITGVYSWIARSYEKRRAYRCTHCPPVFQMWKNYLDYRGGNNARYQATNYICVFYEAITLVLISMAFHACAENESGHPVLLGVITVLLAILWNTLYNTLFELWEKTLVTRGRSVRRRVIHAVGFEVGFVAVTLPIFAWWLNLSLWDAFLLDAGLTLFFMFFTFFYNWLFDLIFGLPVSAQ